MDQPILYKNLNETLVREALVSDLGPTLSNGFRPHILAAFEQVEQAAKESKNPRKIKQSANKAFAELQMDWVDYSAKTMLEWSERHPELGAPKESQQDSELKSLNKRDDDADDRYGGFWEFAIKTVVLTGFIGVMLHIFAAISAIFSTLRFRVR